MFPPLLLREKINIAPTELPRHSGNRGSPHRRNVASKHRRNVAIVDIGEMSLKQTQAQCRQQSHIQYGLALSLAYCSWEGRSLFLAQIVSTCLRDAAIRDRDWEDSTRCSSSSSRSIVPHPKSRPSSSILFFSLLSFSTFSVSSLLSNFVLPILLLPDFFLVLIICFSSSHPFPHLSSHLSSCLASQLSSQLYSQLSSELSLSNYFLYLVFRLFQLLLLLLHHLINFIFLKSSLKVHKRETFLGFDFEICTFSQLVMHKC